jgi:hypothetical protein
VHGCAAISMTIVISACALGGNCAELRAPTQEGLQYGEADGKVSEKDARNIFREWKETLEQKYGTGAGHVERTNNSEFQAWVEWATDRSHIFLMSEIKGSNPARSKATVGVDFMDQAWVKEMMETKRRRSNFEE